ncbi:hypothetical protein ACFFX0_31005 [Citricoccus parietis]|uniref:Uncharacterized protein n=1 Tax=Citricoccus parietis TaxID=592307 RepID=A0ABV5G8S1_9MICC
MKSLLRSPFWGCPGAAGEASIRGSRHHFTPRWCRQSIGRYPSGSILRSFQWESSATRRRR